MSPWRSAIDLLVGQSTRRTEPAAAARNGSSPVPAARNRTGDEVQARPPAFRMPPLTREDVRFAPDSLVERAGFEPSVPGESGFGFAREGPNARVPLSPAEH